MDTMMEKRFSLRSRDKSGERLSRANQGTKGTDLIVHGWRKNVNRTPVDNFLPAFLQNVKTLLGTIVDAGESRIRLKNNIKLCTTTFIY